jgi:hypothetical protein
LQTQDLTISLKKSKGANSLPSLNPEPAKVIRLFRSFIDLIVFAFHNFLATAAVFVVWNQ